MDNPDFRDQKRRKPESELAPTLVTNLSQLLAEQAEQDEQLRKQETPGANQTLVTNLSQVLAEQAERAGEPSPQQPTSSSAWEAAPDPVVPVRRSRPVFFALGLALVATLGGGAVLLRNARPPAPSHPATAMSVDETSAQILNQIERDLQARRWSDVIDKSSKLVGASDVPRAIKDAAESKQARANQEAKTQQVYERFLAAIASGGDDEALARYREIPDGSVYQPLAKERYDQMLSRFVDSHLKAIEAAGPQASCDELRSHIEAILSVVPKHAEVLAVRDRHCPVQAPDGEHVRALPESSPPVEEASGVERANAQRETP